jgi:hypothetical protein
MIPNELLAAMFVEGVAFFYYVAKMDRKLAVIETELKFIKANLGIATSQRQNLG